ncbi:MAG: hypothetical protein RL059_257 [Bacteroidota bacterium]
MEPYLLNIINSIVPFTIIKRAVYINGILESINNLFNIKVENILIDSGAIHASFVNEDFVKPHREVLKEYITPVSGTARLANGSVVPIKEKIIMNLVLVDDNGVDYSKPVIFHILPGLSVDLIVGLPDIIRNFLDLFIQMLRKASVELHAYEGPVNLLSNISDINLLPNYLDGICQADGTTDIQMVHPDDLIDPWQNMIIEEASEEEGIPYPCAFTDALYYMETSVEQARIDYLEKLEVHVDPEVQAIPGAMQWLRDDAIDAFVPRNWEGIRIPPVEFKFKEGMPERRELKPRPVNPKFLVVAHKEFLRLLSYFYVKSNSPIVSPLVIAPKATDPYIRFCGDHSWINQWIERGHCHIPHVRHTLEKLCRFTYFVDIDLTNAYHQIPLGPVTSNYLSVITPWDCVRPLFLPEGVAPATDVLQTIMHDIFGGYEEWLIVIYDNMLILAESAVDAFEKLKIIIGVASKMNIYFKLSKSWIGVKEVNFFGYVCRKGSYKLSDKRKLEISNFPFPDSTKRMRSFLGSAGFFAPFVMNFSEIIAPLHDMCKKDFSWKRDTWSIDYLEIFDQFKKALQNACELFYPDYSLRWILRTDASDIGIGWVLIQIIPDPSDSGVSIEQPIAFGSKKLSDIAKKWAIMEKEAYAMFAAFKNLDYWLRAKVFELETDHRNLRWIEKSENAKIIRWRIFMQGFSFLIRDIPRSRNPIADYLTWDSSFEALMIWLSYVDNSNYDISQINVIGNDKLTELLEQVHGGTNRSGHHGVRRTFNLLNKLYPGHRIPYDVVADFIDRCSICQKFRLGMNDRLQSIERHRKVPNARSAIGVDTLEVQMDRHGYWLLIVVRNLFYEVNHFVSCKGSYGRNSRSSIICSLYYLWVI